VAAARQAAGDALARSERLSSENAALVGRLMELKAREAEKLNEINGMHEEMVGGGRGPPDGCTGGGTWARRGV
jgi:hypothetical protein